MRAMRRLKFKIIPIIMGLAVVCATYWFETSHDETSTIIRERLNNLIYDIRMQLNLATTKPFKPSETEVMVIDIDEKSLKAVGRWPWSRETIADLVDKLREYGAIVIAFDVVFAEPERNVTDLVIEELKEDGKLSIALEDTIGSFKNIFDYDQAFADEIGQQNDTVLGYILTINPEDQVGLLPSPILKLEPPLSERVLINNLPGQIGNLHKIQSQSNSGGFVTTLTDDDGVIRHAPLVLRHNDGIYPSLGLAAVMHYFFLNTIEFNFVDVGDESVLVSLTIADRDIPTDEYGQILVPYQGHRRHFPYVSAVDILTNQADPELIQNRIVFVGTSAIGLGDLHTTPFDTLYPGVEIHATVADAILARSFPVEPDWDLGAKIIMIGTIGIVFAFLLPFLPVWWVVILPFIVTGVLIYFNIWLWTANNIYLSSITVYLMMMGIATVNVMYGFIFEARKRTELKSMFGQYVPKEHVDRMTDSGKNYGFEGESREMSVLFADIRGFTTISEKLTPQQLKFLLNSYFTPMTEVIFKNGGTIDKYVGDMIMAFWGAPLENPDHALDAVSAGFEMLACAEKMSEEFGDIGIDQINIGIGINTGQMNVGDMGSSYRRSYTVLGDSVNLGSRLESATKYYGVKFIISEFTYKACENKIIARHLDRVKVKGKAHAVDIYEPLCFKENMTLALQQELFDYQKALDAYFKAEWDFALSRFHALATTYPDVILYTLYIKRIDALKAKGISAPWDGCFVRDEK